MTSQPAEFRALFLGALPAASRSALAGAASLGEELERALAEARAAWPDVALPDSAFLQHLATKVILDPRRSPLAGLQLGDLYLAAACLAGRPEALASFELKVFPEVRAALRTMSLGPGVVDELLQQLRVTLFVPDPGARPELAGYSGRGSLRSWVRSVAVNAALKSFRGQRPSRQGEDDALADLPSSEDDPELSALKQSHREAYKAAFGVAMAALSPRERTLLRQQLIDGLSIDELGTLYRVHRATAARWLAKAREDLVSRTRKELIAQLQVGDAELDHILGLIRSRLDLSISRQLRLGPGDR